MRKQKKNNKNRFLFIVIILGFVLGIIVYYKFTYLKTPPKDTSKILNTIEQVVEVSSTKYTYSNIFTVTKDKSFNNIKIPFSEKSYIIKYNGVIKGGVNFSDIKIVDDDGKSISLEIDKCSVMDHYIDDENVYIYDIKNSIFNKVDINEVFEDLSNSKKEYETKVIEEGLMDEVKSNTKKSLEISLKNLGYEETNIKFNE